MKRILLCLTVLLLVAGCHGVVLNADYSQLLDETAAWTNEVARRAEVGRMDPNDMARALRLSADHWRCFQDARDGRGPEQ
ncbi:MAG TPA: hypothetical protein VM695_06210 [Phycisphaerae bacterium]|nr:hypothetical protein [Phycisphaerae bacterium]